MKKLGKTLLLVLSSIILIFAVIAQISNTIITTTKYTVSSEKLPESFDNFKIVQISDLHSKEFASGNKRLLDAVDKQKPDIVVMTGDMVNSTDTEYQVFYELAKKLVEKYDVYYIVGNHEQIIMDGRGEDLTAHIRNIGVTVLDNEKKVIKKGTGQVNLYGLWFNLRYYRDLTDEYTKDYYFGTEQMNKILGDSDKERFNIVLAHNPIFFDTYSEWGAHLTLSGHIHGGMIRIPFKGGLFSPEKERFPKYDSGIFQDKGNKLIVSRGLGNGNSGFRFLNCPELVVVTLKKVNND